MGDLCNKINAFGKSVGNETRYRILEALLSGPKTVSELVEGVQCTQPAVSQHLKTLKTSNLVTDERRGQEVVYSANSAYVLGLLKSLTDQVSKEQSRNS